MTHYEEYCLLYDVYGLQMKLLKTFQDPFFTKNNKFFELEIAQIKDAMNFQKKQGFKMFPFYESLKD